LGRLTALTLLAGCATLFGPAVVRWVEPPSRRRTEPALPRRDDCLKAPYTTDRPVTLHGFNVEPRSDGAREFTFTALAGAALEPDELLDLKDTHGAALRAIEGAEQVGLSGCPSASGRPVPCISIGLELCAQPLDALAAALAELAAKNRGKQLVFHVTLLGAAGPRCEADDPKCRPEAYESARYREGERRGLISESSTDPDCAWDGECSRSGCGNACAPWTTAHRPGSCEERPALRDALCGCVDRHCAWFVQ